MVTHSAGRIVLPFYTNFDPVFDQMAALANRPSRLLQTNAAFVSFSRAVSLHIEPRRLEHILADSPLGQHVRIHA